MKKYLLFLLPLLLSIILISCDSATDSNSDNGRLRIHMVDAPAALDSVILNVIRVEVHKDGGDGWLVVNNNSQRIDLLRLTNGISSVISDTALTTGKYTQIRLILGEGNYVVDNGTRKDLSIPSGLQSGLKLNHGFTIEPDNLYELYLDFNVDKSIHLNGMGEYILRPTIRAQAAVISGTISGQVLPEEAKAVVWTTVGEDTVTTFPNETGSFRLMCLPAGTYTVRLSPDTTTGYKESVIEGVVVTAQNNTNTGITTLVK